MSTKVTCGKCGAENRLGMLFCQSCGARLDLSNLNATTISKSSSGGGPIARLVRIVIFLALLAGLGLLCWPVAPAGDAPSADGAATLMNKVRALRGAVQRGNEVVEEVSEAEINARLKSRLIKQEAGIDEDKFKLVLRSVRLDVHPEGTQVWLGNSLGPLRITYVTTAQAVRGTDGRHAFSAGSVKIGHLPMPGPLRDRALKQIIAVFSVLNEELAVLNGVPGVTILDGAVQLSTLSP
ncbi:MAG: zinc ribbon domain-containing protein [Kiritimatiellia bacterium]